MLENPLPVMVHFWSDIWLPDRCEDMAPVIDDVARKFVGKLDAVRNLACIICPAAMLQLPAWPL